MMKTKTISYMLLIGSLLGSMFGMFGCNSERSQGEEYDPNRIQIECAIQDVGMGTEWLYNLKARFEKDYPSAQVIINIVNSELDNGQIGTTLENSQYDVVYVGSTDFNDVENSVKDLTELVMSKSYDKDGRFIGKGQGTVSLGERIQAYGDSWYNSMNVNYQESSPKFISMPYYVTPYGCWYDVDLFQSEGFFEMVYEGIDGVEGTADDSWGADGVENTYDDNLPATFDDFKKLINEMVQAGVTPFTWSGVHGWMRTYYLETVFINYEGVDDYVLNYTMSGNDSQADIGDVTKENGYKLINQDGRKAALAMADFITSNTNFFSADAFKSSQTHLEAQRDFLGSVTRTGSKRIAMLLDGAWWENEAKAYMNEMAGERGSKYAYGTRKFGYMPIPFFEEDAELGIARQETAKTTLRLGRNTCMLVNKKVDQASEEKQSLIENFMLYAQSYDSIKDFTKTTGVVRQVKCNFTDQEIGDWTNMAQEVYHLLNTSDVYMTTSQIGDIQLQYKSLYDGWWFSSKIGNKTYSEPVLAFAENDITVAQYLEGIKTYNPESIWNEVVLGR